MSAPQTEPPKDSVVVEDTGAGRFQARAHAGSATFLIDEPVEVGGLGSGPNPYDLLASALGACTVMTIRLYAERKGWPLTRARAAVTHGRPALQAKDHFERKITLEGDLDDAQRRRLIEIAERCPVHLTLSRGSDITTTLVAKHDQDPRETRLHGDGMDEACDERSGL